MDRGCQHVQGTKALISASINIILSGQLKFIWCIKKYIITDKSNSLVYALHSENPVCHIQSSSCLNINLKGQIIPSSCVSVTSLNPNMLQQW